MPTLEGGDDAEEVEDNKLEGAGSEGEEDQGPGQTEDQAETQQRQHVGPLLGVRAQPQDLHHHGAQHGRVEQEHQAEEAQVGDMVDQRVPDPAPGGKCSAHNGGAGASVSPSARRHRGLLGGHYFPALLCAFVLSSLFPLVPRNPGVTQGHQREMGKSGPVLTLPDPPATATLAPPAAPGPRKLPDQCGLSPGCSLAPEPQGPCSSPATLSHSHGRVDDTLRGPLDSQDDGAVVIHIHKSHQHHQEDREACRPQSMELSLPPSHAPSPALQQDLLPGLCSTPSGVGPL